MNIRKIVICATMASTALLFSSSQADEMIYSGFMSDYTQLEKVTDGTADYRYVAPGGEERMAQFDAVMIDQPEIFIASDSPYRGAKPKHLAALAETLRAGLTSAMRVGTHPRPIRQNLFLLQTEWVTHRKFGLVDSM